MSAQILLFNKGRSESAFDLHGNIVKLAAGRFHREKFIAALFLPAMLGPKRPRLCVPRVGGSIILGTLILRALLTRRECCPDPQPQTLG